METDYKIGDLVWAKRPNLPPWPAFVTKLKKKPKGKSAQISYYVYFFGIKTRGRVESDSLKRFLPAKTDYTRFYKFDNFKEACEAINDVFIKEEGSPFHPISKSRKRKLSSTSAQACEKRSTKKSPDKYSSQSETAAKESDLSSEKASLPNSGNKSQDGEMEILNSSSTKSVSPLTVSPESNTGCKPLSITFGVLGLEIVGSRIAKVLLQSGHRVVVWDKTRQKKLQFAKSGAELALTPQNVVQASKIIFSCASSIEDAIATMYGDCGTLAGLDSSKSYVEFTDMDSETSKNFSETVTSHDAKYLEVRLRGSIHEFEEGSITILAAGDRSLYDKCISCLESFGRKSLFFGKVGNANKAHLAIELIGGTVLASLADSLALAQKIGLPLPELMEFLGLTVLNCPFLMDKGNQISNGIYGSGYPVAGTQEVLNRALKISQEVNHNVPMIATANEMFKHAKRLGLGECDSAAVYVTSRY